MEKGRPIRVLQVCTTLISARAFVAPVARYLAARGYDVAVACSPEPQPDDGYAKATVTDIGGCPFYPVPIPRQIRPLKDLYAFWQLYRLICRLRPDIVHSQNSKASVLARVAARLVRTPVSIYEAHGFAFDELVHPLKKWFYVVIDRWACRFADLVLVETEAIREYGLQNRLVRDPSKLVTVPRGIDLRKFSPSPQGPDNLRKTLGFGPQELVVGTVARLVPNKGLECFLEMAARICAVRSEVRFLIVGDGELRGALERQADDLGIRSKVVFAGHRTDVPQVMQVMDLFVLPTLREGFGIVFAEAMAMGKAVVGSNIGQVAEVVEDGVTGYLVPPEQPEEFARRALELLGDEKKRRAFGDAGRRRVEKLFDEQRMCEAFEQHYQRLLKHKNVVA